MPAADVHPTSRQQPGVLGLLLAVQERFRDIRGQNAASALTHKSAAMAAASAAARMGRAVFFVLIPAFCIVCSTIRAASSGCNGASGYSRSGA